MKEHLTFRALSEYVEGFCDDVARARAEKHLSVCSECRKQCESLKKMINCAISMKQCVIRDTEKFISKTMTRVKRRRVIRLVRHALIPAAAAAALFVVFGINNIDRKVAVQEKPKKTVKAEIASIVDYEDYVGTSVSGRSIVKTLEKYNAHITTVNDEYVEAVVGLRDYMHIRDSFGFVRLPAGFSGGSVGLASVGYDSESVSFPRNHNPVKIRIRRK